MMFYQHIALQLCIEMSIEPCKEAVRLLRAKGYKKEVFMYFLAKEVDETLDRIQTMVSFDKKITPFVMPFRDIHGDGKILNKELSSLARWCNFAAIRKTCTYEEYKYRRK